MKPPKFHFLAAMDLVPGDSFMLFGKKQTIIFAQPNLLNGMVVRFVPDATVHVNETTMIVEKDFKFKIQIQK